MWCVCLSLHYVRVFVSDCFAEACPYTNCVDLVKLVLWNLFPNHSSLDSYSCHGPCLCKTCVFSLVQEAQEERRRLCSRWTESDRGRERWSEFLVKAAGQWGRQKLIREAASFTTPQLDHLCVRGQQFSWLWQSLKGVFVCPCMCVCVCLCVYLPARGNPLPPLPSSIWLAHPNKPHANYHLWRASESHFLWTSVNWMTISKWHLRRADVLKPSSINNRELVIIVLSASCNDEERDGGSEMGDKWEKLKRRLSA